MPYTLPQLKRRDSNKRASTEAGAVHLVLAGSITEGLLLNYLEVIGHCPPKGQTTREISLGAMLKACVDAGDLSTDAERLCGVLKEYRDLVHPGRVLRERPKPDSSQRDVAKQAVERVASDMPRGCPDSRRTSGGGSFYATCSV